MPWSISCAVMSRGLAWTHCCGAGIVDIGSEGHVRRAGTGGVAIGG